MIYLTVTILVAVLGIDAGPIHDCPEACSASQSNSNKSTKPDYTYKLFYERDTLPDRVYVRDVIAHFNTTTASEQNFTRHLRDQLHAVGRETHGNNFIILSNNLHGVRLVLLQQLANETVSMDSGNNYRINVFYCGDLVATGEDGGPVMIPTDGKLLRVGGCAQWRDNYTRLAFQHWNCSLVEYRRSGVCDKIDDKDPI